MEARGRVGGGRVGLVRETHAACRVLVHGPAIAQVRRRLDIVDGDGGGVVVEAAVLVDDARGDGVGVGAVVEQAGRHRGRGGSARVAIGAVAGAVVKEAV